MLILSHAIAMCLLKDFLTLWVHAGSLWGLLPSDRGFFSLCGPTQFSLI